MVDVRIAVLKSARMSYSKATVVAYPFGLTSALRVAVSASTEVEAFVTDVGGPTAGITSGNQPDVAVLFSAVNADSPPQHHTRSNWSSAQEPEIETAIRERTMSFGMYGARYVFPPSEVPVPSSFSSPRPKHHILWETVTMHVWYQPVEISAIASLLGTVIGVGT